jgi:asparagine synthase (glutamine-hydrolysing)
MCGIVGVASTSPQSDKSWLPVARDLLAHRGPDDAGEWWSSDNRVGFGHRRLSIIDLSQAGHQPMVKSDLGLGIVFNGEIYNYRELRDVLASKNYIFTSDSDTEIVLLAYKEWGCDCLSRLNGMFAFAIHDANQATVFFARDRAGEKPLFYIQTNEALYFASELKALLSLSHLPRKISSDQLESYLAFGYVPSPNCILQGYRKLPPAYAMQYSINNSKLKTWRYWEIPEPSSGSLPERDLIGEMEQLLDRAVKRQLTADVPVGVLLSGGIDSSLVTAMACRHSENVQTFSIVFPGHTKNDESRFARVVASHFGTKHVELAAEETTAELVPALARQFDEPMVDSSMVPTWLVSKLVRKHCAVALGGDGGDELFGGYMHHRRLLAMSKWHWLIPDFAKVSIANWAKKSLHIGQKGRNYLQTITTDLRKELPFLGYLFDEEARARLFPDAKLSTGYPERRFQELTPRQRGIVERATRMDFGTYLSEDLLVKVDRVSMMNSLEIRAPFLDQEIIEFAFGKVPERLKASKSRSKVLLKKLAQKVLPRQLELDRKQGFSIPLASWLKNGSFRELFWQTLTDRDCVFDQTYIQYLLNGQDRGLQNSERLFSLVLFELWRKEYRISL